MSQTRQLIKTLKQSQKAHGLNYAHVTKHIDLSEASIKRLFSDNTITLDRLGQICSLMDMQITDLVRLMEIDNRFQIDPLTREQA